MGKGLAFLNLKFFHPGNKDNQRRKWEALQRDAERQRKIKERELELEQEKQITETRKLLFEQEMGADSLEYRKEALKEQVSFLYNPPPGYKKQIEKERKKVEEEKRLKEWQGAMEQMSKEERRLAERELESGLSVHERNVSRFEFLKNAPMAAEYVKNMDVQHKPFGISVRQVRCLKCGKWGHRIHDRECTMNEYDPLHRPPQKQKQQQPQKHDVKQEHDDHQDDHEAAAAADNKAAAVPIDDKQAKDPLNAMKSKLIHRHLQKYEGDSTTNTTAMTTTTPLDARSTIVDDSRSVFTLNPDQSAANAKMFAVKTFQRSDAQKYDLVGERACEEASTKRDKKKKRKHAREDDRDGTHDLEVRYREHRQNGKNSKKTDASDDEDEDEDMKFIMSLDEASRLKMLREIERREKERKRKKKKRGREDSIGHGDDEDDAHSRHSHRRHKTKTKSKSKHRSSSPVDSRSRSRSRSRNDRHHQHDGKYHRKHDRQ